MGPPDLSPIQKAFDRMYAAQQAARVFLSHDSMVEGEVVRPDIVHAIRAAVIFARSADDYLMVFGIGGRNPCVADPVLLPTWHEIQPHWLCRIGWHDWAVLDHYSPAEMAFCVVTRFECRLCPATKNRTVTP